MGAHDVMPLSNGSFPSLCNNGDCAWAGEYDYGAFHRGQDGVCYFAPVWFAAEDESPNNIHFAVIEAPVVFA